MGVCFAIQIESYAIRPLTSWKSLEITATTATQGLGAGAFGQTHGGRAHPHLHRIWELGIVFSDTVAVRGAA